MWFSLFATILILTVTFYQGLQGVFSALINCVLTILAAVLAFGFYEDLYQMQLATYQPDHGRAIALIGIFVVTLLILRTAVDQLIKGNLHFPIYLDRAGGGVIGIITAMVIIGMLAIGFQMLPFGSSFLGFSRFSLYDRTSNKEVLNAVKVGGPGKGMDDDYKNALFRSEVEWNTLKTSRHNLWLNPDGFTVALVSYLSEFALQGRNGFADLNPDFLDYLHHMRDGLARESLAAIGPDAIRVKEYKYLRENQPVYRRTRVRNDTGNEFVKFDLADRKPGPGRRWMEVTAKLSEKTDKLQDREAFNFTSSQVRLLARDRKDGPVVVYPLVGINEDDKENAHRLVEVFPCQDIQYKRSPSGTTEIRFLFEVPDSPAFQPWMIQYKLNGRDEILPSQDQTDGRPGSGDSGKTTKPDRTKPAAEPSPGTPGSAQPPSESPSPTPEPPKPDSPDGSSSTPPSPSNPNPPDRVHGVNLAGKQPFFDDKLPFPLTEYAEGMDMERSGPKLVGVRSLTAKLSKDWQPAEGSKSPLETFDVPENMRLLHLTVEQLHPESWLGNILQTAVNQVRNIYLIDSNGKEYMPVGKYAIATIRGETLFELTYFNETNRIAGHMPGFEHIRFDDLKGKYAYVFLFHVPPGTRATKFHTGRANISLDQFNLVAPK